jgi:hypothetical protein
MCDYPGLCSARILSGGFSQNPLSYFPFTDLYLILGYKSSLAHVVFRVEPHLPPQLKNSIGLILIPMVIGLKGLLYHALSRPVG